MLPDRDKRTDGELIANKQFEKPRKFKKELPGFLYSSIPKGTFDYPMCNAI